MIKADQEIVCNYCGLYNQEPYLIRNDITIVKCKNCGLLYVNPQFKEHDLLRMYGQNYFQSKDPLVLGYQNYFKERESIEKAAQYYLDIIGKFISFKEKKLLEVGCAFGFFLNKAQERGLDVYGVEISDFAAEIARKHFKLRVHTDWFPKIKLPQNFDIVVMWTTLEHVNDPFIYLEKAHRVLKSGGLLFISVPDAGGILARLTGKKWPGFQKAQEHNYFFTFVTLANLLKKVGFEVVGKQKAPFFCNLDFIAKKLAQYNPLLSQILIKFFNFTKISHYFLNVGLIDMLVIAKKNEKN